MTDAAIESNGHLASIQDALREDIRDALEGRRRVALANFPDITNVGDSAIWLGTIAILTSLDVEVCWQGAASDVDVRSILETEPEAILLNGGGNFGDLWRGQQQARELILASRPATKVIQLPQSAFFRHGANALRNAELWARIQHGTILWREERSLGWAMRSLPGVDHRLSHDMAFGLSGLDRTRRHRFDAVWIMRTDQESLGRQLPDLPSSMEVTDWAASDGDTPALSALRADAAREHADRDTDYRRLGGIYQEMAEIRLARGIGILSLAEAVVTDRLHAHLLATLLGQPQVLLDNSYGKVFSVHRHSIGSDPHIRLAADPNEALDVLKHDLLRA